MYEYIYLNLIKTYEIILYIHQLYLKYNQSIKFKSFESFGKGIDTTYKIIQIKEFVPPILLTKIKIINKRIYLLPNRIITSVGIWTFISEPHYIKDDYNFTIDLCNTLNLKYILPYTQSEEYGLLEPMFIIQNFKDFYLQNSYTNKIKYMNLDTLTNIYNYYDVIENINELFNNFTYGPDVIDYIFDKFIDRLILLNIINDKKYYFKKYKETKNKIEYMNKIKEIYLNKRKYYNKRNLSTLFYYTNLN
jgi:hypothetical protein